MATITTDELNIVSTPKYRVKRRLCVDPRTIVFQAQINGTPDRDSYTRGYYQFAIDNITLGTIGAIDPGMTIEFGTTSGESDIGRTRVRSASGSVIKIAETAPGTLGGLADNMYVTVREEYRLWAVLPLLRAVRGSNGLINNYTSYRDFEIDYTDENEEIEPLVNIYAKPAGSVDEGETFRTVDFTITTTPMANGRTPANPTFDWKDGTVITGPSHATANNVRTTTVTVTFPQTTFMRYIEVVGADSAGNSKTKKFPIWVCGTTPPITKFMPTRDDTVFEGGREMTFEFFGSDNEYDEYDALICYWEEADFDGVEPPADYRDQYLGWPLGRDTTLKIHAKGTFILPTAGPARFLDRLRGWSVTVHDKNTPAAWNHIDDLTNDRWTHMWLRHYTTFLTMFNLELSGLTRQAKKEQVPAGNIFPQIKKFNEAYALTRASCDSLGGIWLRPEYATLSSADRITRGNLMSITAAHLTDSKGLEITDDILDEVGQLKGAGSSYDGAGGSSSQYKAIAQGRTPGQQGSSTEAEYQRLPTTSSQSVLNQWLGDRIAMMNNKRKGIPLYFLYNMDVVEPAWNQPIVVTWAHPSINGLEISTDKFIPRKVSIKHSNDIDKPSKLITVTTDGLTTGTAAQKDYSIRKTAPSTPGVGGQTPQITWPNLIIPTTPPQFGINPVVNNGSLAFFRTERIIHRVASFYDVADPVYDTVDLTGVGGLLAGNERFYEVCLDPASRGTGQINVWVTSDFYLYYIEDIFGASPIPSIAYDFGGNTNGSSMIDADYLHEGDIGQFVVVVYTLGNAPLNVAVATDGVTWNLEKTFGLNNNGFQSQAMIIDPHRAGVAWMMAKDTGDANVCLYEMSNYGSTFTKHGSIETVVAGYNGGSLFMPLSDTSGTRLFYGTFPSTEIFLKRGTISAAGDTLDTEYTISVGTFDFGPRPGRWTISSPSGNRNKLLAHVMPVGAAYRGTVLFNDVESASPTPIWIVPPTANGVGFARGVLLDPTGDKAILMGDGNILNMPIALWDGFSVIDKTGNLRDGVGIAASSFIVGVVGND